MIASKSLQRTVNETGEISVLTEASQPLQAVGSRWPYPHRADGTESPEGAPGDVPGGTSGEMGASEPPNRINDMAEPEPHDTLEPRGGDDGKMPTRGRKPNPPAAGSLTRATSMTTRGHAADHPHARRVKHRLPKSAGTTRAPGSRIRPGEDTEADTRRTPLSLRRSTRPRRSRTGTRKRTSDVVHGKGAAQVTDANPVEWRHVYAVMESNFPDSALEWVKHRHGTGPCMFPGPAWMTTTSAPGRRRTRKKR